MNNACYIITTVIFFNYDLHMGCCHNVAVKYTYWLITTFVTSHQGQDACTKNGG